MKESMASRSSRELDTPAARVAETRLFVGLLGVWLVHLVFVFSSNMWGWGVNMGRFSPPAATWLSLGLWAACFLPAPARLASEALDRLGGRLDSSWLARLVFCLGAALLVLCLPDRTWYLGDFLIRRGGLSAALTTQREQALPLERLLFDFAPSALGAVLPGLSSLHRLIGALAAGLLAHAAITCGRVLSRSPATISVTALGLTLGGHMIMNTGLGKPAALLCALTGYVVSIALRPKPGWSYGARCGVAVAAAIALHRSGLLLIPAWMLVVSRAARDRTPGSSIARAALMSVAVLPLAALLLLGGRMLHVLVTLDLPHHIASAMPVPGFGATVVRTSDVVNTLLLLSPLLMLAPAAGFAGWSRCFAAQGRGVMLVAMPWLVAIVLVVPQQGMFRDVDVFAPAGFAWSALLLLVIAPAVEASQKAGLRTSAPLVMAGVISTLQLLLISATPAAGLDRIHAYATESPARPDNDLGRTWDFLALRAFALEDWREARAAAAYAVRYEPSSRLWVMLGVSSAYTHDYAAARAAFSSALDREPGLPEAMVGLAGAALSVGDTTLAESTIVRMNRVAADAGARGRMRRFVAKYPAVYPQRARGAQR